VWAKKRIDRALKQHDARCERYRKREDAWLATRRKVMDAPKVRFVYERMDVLLSYITAEKPMGKVAPLSSGQGCIDAAKLMDKAINEWRRRDNRVLKQYEQKLTACVYGVGPAKSYWLNDRVEETWRVPILDPVTGEASGERFETKKVDVKDQPSLALVNPYDFAWDPSAVSSDLSDAEFVCHWSFPTLAYLKANDVARGTKENPGIYRNTDDVAELTPRTQGSRNRQGSGRDLTGRVELCEVWARNRLVVIANGATCIRDEANPFLHHDLPYVIATTMPNLTGSIETSSEVELIMGIQNELWELRRQYVLNMSLANKLIALFDGQMSDPEPTLNALRGDDQFVGIPYEANGGAPPITWQPTGQLLQAGLEGMEQYKKDMDDMSGLGPYISGDTETQVDPKTATEITTLQGASMRRINKTRNILNQADQRAANLELKLTRQFMNKPLEIRIDGYDAGAAIPGDEWSFDYVDPAAIIDADLEYVIRDADEDLDQEQKRSEANARMQMTIEVATAAAPLGQGAPNLKKAFEFYVEAYGEDEPEEWWIEPPPPPPPMPLPAVAPGGSNGVPFGGGPPGAAPPVPANPPLGGPGGAAPPSPPNGVALPAGVLR